MSNTPYVGLRPFQRDEANIFFGRKQHTEELLEEMNQHHFLSVVGASGSGKTSLINASLIPRLMEGSFALPDAHWHIAEMTPGNQPFVNLSAALNAEDALGEHPSAFTLTPDRLKSNATSLHEWLHDHPLAPNGKLLIICDQFEDIYRYPSQESADFIKLLITSSHRYTGQNGVTSNPVFVMVVVRSDYLDDNHVYPQLAAVMDKGVYHLPELSQEQLRIAIEKPANMYGGEVELELVTQLLLDAENNPDQLPLLQHALLSLWTKSTDKKLTIFDYFVLGGLKRIISNHADQIYLALTVEQQNIASLLFKSLTETASKHHALALPIKLSEMAAIANINWQGIVTVVEAFRKKDQGFLLPAQPTPLLPDTLLDIAHDSFIRQWQRLNDWIEEEKKSAEQYAQLLNFANMYETPPETLLRPPELNILWDWYKETKPTAAWAKRYGGNFHAAIAFLQKSHKTAKLKKASMLISGITVTSLFIIIGNFLYFSRTETAAPIVPAIEATTVAVQEKKTPIKRSKPDKIKNTITKAPDVLVIAENNPVPTITPLPTRVPVLPTTTPKMVVPEITAPKPITPEPTKAALVKITPTATTTDSKVIADLNKRFPDKLQLMQEYKNLDIKDPILWHKLADQLRRQSEQERQPSKADAAIEAYQTTVDLDANDYKAWFSMGDIYRIRTEDQAEAAKRDNNRDQALHAFNKVTSLYPNSEWAFYYLGTLYQQQKKFDEAIESYKKQLAVTPKHKFAWHYLGSAYQKQNKFQDAIAAYQEALKINPNNPEAKKQLHALESSTAK